MNKGGIVLEEQTLFIGMKMRFMKDKKVKKVALNMFDYIPEAIEDFGEDESKVVSSPGTCWLLFTRQHARMQENGQ